MPAPRTGPCADWAVEGDLCSPCDDYELDAAIVADALQSASEILFHLSGRQFSGECEETVRPCSRWTKEVRYGQVRPPASFVGQVEELGVPRIVCRCQSGPACGCSRLDEITLGGRPIRDISEVRVDGAVLDDSLYRVDDYSRLVRLDDPDGTNPGWPCCQDLAADPATDDDTFQVTFTYGQDPPQSGVTAAAVLACEFILACSPETLNQCRLPRKVVQVVRQGVTISKVDPTDILQSGRTGLLEVDLFLQSVNPNNLQRRARVISPDRRRRVRRAGT